MGRHEGAGFWFAAVPEERWPDDPEWRARVRTLWQGGIGDRRQEIVFIGIDMDEAAIRAGLDTCLLTDAEHAAGPNAWSRLADPFPAWSSDAP